MILSTRQQLMVGITPFLPNKTKLHLAHNAAHKLFPLLAKTPVSKHKISLMALSQSKLITTKFSITIQVFTTLTQTSKTTRQTISYFQSSTRNNYLARCDAKHPCREYILFHGKQNQISVPYAERALLHILHNHHKAAAVAVKSELNIQMRQPSTPGSPHKPSTGTGKDICEGRHCDILHPYPCNLKI